MEGVNALIKAHPEVEVHIYNADHGFNCDQRGAYNEEAATKARELHAGLLRQTSRPEV
jgi:carboxymethylenebutenolidase